MTEPLDFSSPLAGKLSFADPRLTRADNAGVPVECPTPERCLQALDPSFASVASHIGDCTLDCSYCAYRWTARRAMLEQE